MRVPEATPKQVDRSSRKPLRTREMRQEVAKLPKAPWFDCGFCFSSLSGNLQRQGPASCLKSISDRLKSSSVGWASLGPAAAQGRLRLLVFDSGGEEWPDC